MSEAKKLIICEVCKKSIEQIPQEMLQFEREHKADIVITRDAYWNDAGIFSIIRTRRFFHKKCFEDMLKKRREELGWEKRNEHF